MADLRRIISDVSDPSLRHIWMVPCSILCTNVWILNHVFWYHLPTKRLSGFYHFYHFLLYKIAKRGRLSMYHTREKRDWKLMEKKCPRVFDFSNATCRLVMECFFLVLTKKSFLYKNAKKYLEKFGIFPRPKNVWLAWQCFTFSTVNLYHQPLVTLLYKVSVLFEY
jgi:hypothetical protein